MRSKIVDDFYSTQCSMPPRTPPMQNMDQCASEAEIGIDVARPTTFDYVNMTHCFLNA